MTEDFHIEIFVKAFKTAMVEPALEGSHFDTEQSEKVCTEKVCSEKVCSENASDLMKEQRMVFNLAFPNLWKR